MKFVRWGLFGSWQIPGDKPGQWNENDIFETPETNLRAKAGEFPGPDYGSVVDLVRVPKWLDPGLYSITKYATANPDRERWPSGIEIAAWFRVVK